MKSGDETSSRDSEDGVACASGAARCACCLVCLCVDCQRHEAATRAADEAAFRAMSLPHPAAPAATVAAEVQ